MRTLRTSVSCLALLTGFTVASIVLSSTASAEVCGMKADGPKTYDSARSAKADKAVVAHQGSCVIFCQGFAPTLITGPMCGMDPLNHAKITYPNNCAAENARAIWVHNGPCKK
jgi:hypothetical protein